MAPNEVGIAWIAPLQAGVGTGHNFRRIFASIFGLIAGASIFGSIAGRRCGKNLLPELLAKVMELWHSASIAAHGIV